MDRSWKKSLISSSGRNVRLLARVHSILLAAPFDVYLSSIEYFHYSNWKSPSPRPPRSGPPYVNLLEQFRLPTYTILGKSLAFIEWLLWDRALDRLDKGNSCIIGEAGSLGFDREVECLRWSSSFAVRSRETVTLIGWSPCKDSRIQPVREKNWFEKCKNSTGLEMFEKNALFFYQ